MKLNYLLLSALLCGGICMADETSQVNLLETAISSQVLGENPRAPWVCYNEAGSVVNTPNRTYTRDLDLADGSGTVRVIFTRWNDGYSDADIFYTYPLDLEGGYEYDLSVFTGYWNNFPGNTANYVIQPVDNSPTLQANITQTPGLDALMMPQTTDDWTFDVVGSSDSQHWLGSQTTKTHTFYAPVSGRYYLSFISPAGIYPIGELSLTRANAVSVETAPTVKIDNTVFADDNYEMRLSASGEITISLEGTNRMAVAFGASGSQMAYSLYNDPIKITEAGEYVLYCYSVGQYSSQVIRKTITVLPAQPVGGNLLANALDGQLGKNPTGWTVYTRAGNETGFPVNATLRNGDMGTDGFPELLALRWDGDIRDAYYTYRINIPVAGVYTFSMKATEWSNYNEENTASAQVRGRSAMRVSLTQTPGYNYMDSQSVIFDMPSDHPGANKTGPSGNPYNFQECTTNFFAEAGEYYLSFTGASGLYPIGDLKLELNNSLQINALPAAPVILANGVEVSGQVEVNGSQIISFTPADAAISYIWQDGEENIPLEYQKFNSLTASTSGTLYAYQTVEGIHGAVAMVDMTVGLPKVTDDMIEVTGATLTDGVYEGIEGQTPVVTFTPGTDMTITWFYTPSVATSIKFPETPQVYTEPIELPVAGTLQFYCEVNGLRGLMQTLRFTNIRPGNSAVDSVMTDEYTEYYTIDGMKLNASPTRPGLYIERRSTGTRTISIRN